MRISRQSLSRTAPRSRSAAPSHPAQFAAGAAADASSVKKGNIRCGFESGVLMKPLDGGSRVEVTMLTRIDLKIPLLPNWVFDMVSKKMAPNTVPMLAKQVCGDGYAVTV
jgi:hypothetical protein